MDLINDAVVAVSKSEDGITQQLAHLETLGIENYVLYRAKSDHLLWKKRLASLISGMSSLDESELADHNSCRLGKWWNSAKKSNPNLSATFLQIEEPHRQVHYYGKEAARKFNAGDRSGSLESYFNMDNASTEVVRLLDILIHETKK